MCVFVFVSTVAYCQPLILIVFAHWMKENPLEKKNNVNWAKKEHCHIHNSEMLISLWLF